MCKNIFLLFTLCLSIGLASIAKADTPLKNKSLPVKLVEVGFDYGIAYGVGNYYDTNTKPYIAQGINLRFNLKKSFDVGFYVGQTSQERIYPSLNGDKIHYSTLFALTSNYNWNRGQNVSWFAGLGLGTAYCQGNLYSDDKVHALIMPRVGVELFRHYRVSIVPHIIKKGYHDISIQIGFTLGGGLKK